MRRKSPGDVSVIGALAARHCVSPDGNAISSDGSAPADSVTGVPAMTALVQTSAQAARPATTVASTTPVSAGSSVRGKSAGD